MATPDLKVLAIDDNPDNLMVLKAVITDAFPGVKVITALTGARGLELALSEDPDVILLDIVMPGMDGYAVCRKLKENAHLQHIPVVFLTALKTGRQSRIQALEAGAEAFLSKPIDEAELTAQLRAMAKIKAANVLQQQEKERLAALVAERTSELEQELAHRRQAEAALRSLAESGYALGEGVFRFLAQELAVSLGVRCILLARIEPGNPHTAQILAAWDRGRLKSNFSYPLEGTPCQEVLTQGEYFCPGRVQVRYPQARLLAELSAESYWGVPLQDSTGKVTGVLAAIDDRPMVERLQPLGLLGSFAARAAAELERMQVEEQLQASQRRYSDLFEGSRDGMVVVDAQGHFLDANQAYCDMLGYSLEELRALDNFYCLTPKKWQAWEREEIWDHRLIQEGYSGVYEKEYIRKDGTVFPVELQSFTVFDAADQPLYLWGSARDITSRKQTERLIQEQKEQLLEQNKRLQEMNADLFANTQALLRAENELRTLNADLEQRVDERTLELAHANAELAQANAALQRAARSKDDFLANMSHELRTPLTGILGLSEALQMEIYGPLSDKQRQSLQAIYASGRHLQDLITDILDLSKLEAGKMELQPGLVDVENVCQASLLFIKQQAFKKDLRVSTSFDRRAGLVTADERRLKQMLVNLLGNAVKFTLAGGEVGLEVIADPTGQEVHFVVWDTGIGIPPASQERLFQPFTQLDNRLAREHEGSGLGLALVQRLAEMHGGRVSVESEGVPGRGSRFTLALPWQPARRPTGGLDKNRLVPVAAAQSANVPPGGQGQLIVLAEDNELNRLAVADYLESRGYRVADVGEGQAALDLVHRLRPVLVLMDIQMPGMDGLEALRRLRADPDPALAATPVVALTALAMRGDRERCLEAGANAYLAKPVNLVDLSHLVAQLIYGDPHEPLPGPA